jgi:ElaB/YqjD/DUF883 family membrane-anchored ribosome-binding protein
MANLKSNERELGEIGQRLKTLEKGQHDANEETKQHRERFDQRLDEIKHSQEEFQKEVRTYISEARGAVRMARGAWKVTGVIAAVISTISVFAWKVGIWLFSLPIK